MDDVQEGCEGAVAALKGWIDALAARDFDYLDRVLSNDFQFTCSPDVGGGRMDKARFIELDRHIYNAEIRFLGLTARRLQGTVVTQVFASVREEFRGDLGPGMPIAAEMNAKVDASEMAYASAWRQDDGGEWQCFSHHVFGAV